MNKELVINSTPVGSEIALLEDKRLVEFHQERGNNDYTVGDIYLGRIKKLIPGLNAAFVDVGYQKDAFLHYTDLGPQVRSLLKLTRQSVAGNVNDPLLKNFKLQPEIVKTGKISEVLKNKQPILVQILKEPISTKGPRLSCEITIAGRFLVLAPFTDSVGVSKKIASEEERKRLKRLVSSLKPAHFGLVVRTAAQGKGAAELHEDIINLFAKWKLMVENLGGKTPPKKVLSEMDKSSSILRDLLSSSFNKVVTNDNLLAKDLEIYIEKIAPDKKNIVNTYKGRKPLFDNFGITRQIKSSFGKTVSFKGGAYLVIEHTEAMHVIDVNSGHKATMSGSQESNALRVNLDACDEVARQLRLRDLGGIIIVDFIDMKIGDSRKQVYKRLRDAMKPDRATHSILPLTKFNLMQITRSRVKPEIMINTAEICPSCGGSGKIEASLLIIEEIERKLAFLLKKEKKIRLIVHPFIEAFLRKGIYSKFWQWKFKYRKSIRLSSISDLGMTQYKFYNSDDEELKI
ncbi:MAG: Rne/Rng family ribonuclease [Chitinophagales bacterium]|nr:Rne/Rng family ribonuclease [Chitinophagales bacterium]